MTSAPATRTAPDRSWRRPALLGALLLAVLLALAALTRTAALTHADLRADRAVQPLRSHAATTAFLWLTDASAEVVGLAALAAGLLVLLARRRPRDAVRLLLTAGGAWGLALVLKTALDRPRPPSVLWVRPPDATGSFPSGHDTTATVLVVVVLLTLAGMGRARRIATACAVVFALAVGFGRIYLGDHYPTDVLGSYLTVAATALLVRAAAELPVEPMSWRGRRSAAACLRPAARETHDTAAVPALVRPPGHPHGLALPADRADQPEPEHGTPRPGPVQGNRTP
jgi:undecaprenyl-diphosphatase